MARTVQRWTGRESRALRESMRLSVRSFAERLGVSDRAVSKWEAGSGDRVPGPESQAILDTAFQQTDAITQSRFWEAIGVRETVASSGGRGFALVPDLEPMMIPREDLLNDVVTAILSASHATGAQIVTIAGPGGFGKTTAATQVCHDPRVREVFPEVLWVETGEDCKPARVTHLVSDLCFHLEGVRPELSDPEQAGFHLARVIGERPLLLVVDNVWSGSDLSPFLLGAPNCVRLVTTRNLRVAPTSSHVIRTGPMRPDEIAELLQRTLPSTATHTLRPVAELCGGWPLLANLVGASVSSDIGSGASVERALQAARDALVGYGPQAFDVWDSDQRKVTISHVISATLRGLDTNVQVPGADGLSDRYLSMAVFPPSTPIRLDVLSRWWGEAHGWSPVAVRHYCRILADRSLISSYRADQDDIVLHDVFRAYLRGLVASRMPELHRSLLDALRPSAGWSTLPADRTYEWENVAYHLVGAGDYGSLARLASDPTYVIGKATACGANALRSDRDLVAAAQARTTDSEHLLLLDRAHLLAEQGYLLHGLKTGSEMAVTLLVALVRAGHQPPEELVILASEGADVRWSQETADAGNPGHVGTVVAIESRGDLLVSGGEDGLVRLWDLKSRTLTRTLSGHTGWVHSVAISPDSSLVASAGEDNVIRLWAVADGSQVGVLPGHHKRIRSLSFAERSTELASGAEDGLIKFWDLSSLTLARQLTTRGVGIWSISLSEDGTMVAASGEDEYVRLLDIPTGELLDEKALHSNWVRAVRFRSRHELVSAAADGTARLWDTSNRKLDPAGVLDADAERLRALAIHAGKIITAGENATITAHGASPQQVRMPANVNWIRAVTSTPHGVAAACEDGGIRLWNPGADTLELIAAGRDTTWAAAFTERGIALGGADGKIRVHDPNTGTTASALPAGTGRVWALTASGAYLAGACGDGRLRVWHDHQLIHELNDDVTLTWAVQINQDATLMAASDTNGHVRVWTLPDGRLVWDHDAAAGRVRYLSISAPAGLIAAAGGDGTVRMWTLADGEERETIKVPGWARTVAFDRLGERLAIGTGTGDIYVHRLGTAEDPVHLQGHQGRVLLLGFSDDGAWLISTAADGTARRWPLDEGTAFQVRVDASGQCAALDPSTMDLLVASASGQVLIRLGSDTTGATG